MHRIQPLVRLTLVVLFGTGSLPQTIAQDLRSYYVPMSDGVRLAIDVHLPAELGPGKQVPAILELTRYWRAAIDPASGQIVRALDLLDRACLARGYAIVKVDMRGSGASFGSRLDEYGPSEVRDGYAIVDWVAHQPWCNGNVGAMGISYSGTTAEFVTASRHPALKAVIPGWSDFDDYASPCRPYGLVAAGFLDDWSRVVGQLDRNDSAALGAAVKPVDPELLSQAVAEHRSNPEVSRVMEAMEFRDQGFEGSRPMEECASLYWRKEIEASQVPMLVLASWLDAGTADGALLRFQNYRNRQYLVILASAHGGRFHASPFTVGAQRIPPIPTLDEQQELRLAFFDHYLKGIDNEVPNWPAIRYFNMGEEQMRSSAVWPPPGTELQIRYLTADRQLAGQAPTTAAEPHRYRVDWEVETGEFNRWTTQMGRPILSQDHREQLDARMLCFDSPPATAPLQINGSVEVDLWMSTSAADGYVLCYLESVAPDGQSRYLSEGGLRFLHRKLQPSPLAVGDPQYHSFRQADAEPVVPGAMMQVALRMWPVAVQIPAGHRLRLAIAGADRAVFARLPAEGDVTLEVWNDPHHPSQIRLPLALPSVR